MVVAGADGTHALQSLTVTDANDVHFAQRVAVQGDVLIEASGEVRFDALLQVEHGSLHIIGASRLVLGDVVLDANAAQEFVITADNLLLQGMVQGQGSSLVLNTAQAGRNLTLGSTGSGLVLDADAVNRLQGFASVVVGDARTGALAVDVAVLAGLHAPLLDLQGDSVGVSGQGTVVSATQLAVTSRAALHMDVGTSLVMPGGLVTLRAAGDIALTGIDTTHAGSGTQGAPRLCRPAAGRAGPHRVPEGSPQASGFPTRQGSGWP